MVAALLDACDLDPTVINGGIVNAYGTNARLGAGEWMVVEADESDGTFLKLPADVAIVTNLTHEHLELHGSWEAYRDAKMSLFERLREGPANPGKPGFPKSPIVHVDDPPAGLSAGAPRDPPHSRTRRSSGLLHARPGSRQRRRPAGPATHRSLLSAAEPAARKRSLFRGPGHPLPHRVSCRCPRRLRSATRRSACPVDPKP